MAAETGKPFQLVAGHPSLDFINTFDFRFRVAVTGDPAHSIPAQPGPIELLNTYDDLLRFLTQSELLTDRQARKLRRSDATPAQRAHVLHQAVQLREALASVAYGLLEEQQPSPEALAILEPCFKQAAASRTLAVASLRLDWTWKGLSRNIASPLWLLADTAADLFLSEHTAQLRACAADTCRWLFLDTSKNHTRRWCDMKICGNRTKARRFQARQSSLPGN